jgi:hypothetical protein
VGGVVCILVCTVRFAADERAACALHEVHRPHHTTDNTTTRSLARVRRRAAGSHRHRQIARAGDWLEQIQRQRDIEERAGIAAECRDQLGVVYEGMGW